MRCAGTRDKGFGVEFEVEFEINNQPRCLVFVEKRKRKEKKVAGNVGAGKPKKQDEST